MRRILETLRILSSEGPLIPAKSKNQLPNRPNPARLGPWTPFPRGLLPLLLLPGDLPPLGRRPLLRLPPGPPLPPGPHLLRPFQLMDAGLFGCHHLLARARLVLIYALSLDGGRQSLQLMELSIMTTQLIRRQPDIKNKPMLMLELQDISSFTQSPRLRMWIAIRLLTTTAFQGLLMI